MKVISLCTERPQHVGRRQDGPKFLRPEDRYDEVMRIAVAPDVEVVIHDGEAYVTTGEFLPMEVQVYVRRKVHL